MFRGWWILILATTLSQLTRQHATSNGACWRASTLQQSHLRHSPVRSDFCHSPRRHPVRLRRWLPNTSRHFFIPFKLQLIHLMVFYSYIRTLKCIMFIRAVIKARKNLNLYLNMYFVLFLKWKRLLPRKKIRCFRKSNLSVDRIFFSTTDRITWWPRKKRTELQKSSSTHRIHRHNFKVLF